MKIAAVFSVIAIACALAGCTKDGDRSIRVRLDHFQLNMDPATLADIESRKVATLVHAGLVAVASDGKVHARLAKAWKKIDPATWEFEIREGVHFTDGSVADAKAVVRSLCWAMQPAHLYSWSLASVEHRKTAGGAVECTGLTAEGDSMVRIRETQPVPWLLEALDGPAGWIVGNPGAKPGAWGTRPGIGPYRIDAIATGAKIELVSRKDGAVAPRAARITFEHLPDPLVAAQRFVNGEIDLMRVDAPQIVEFMREKRIDLLQHSFGRVRIVIISTAALEKKGFSKEGVQSFVQTYADAVDRPKIASMTAGLGSPLMTAFPPAAAQGGYAPPRRNLTAADFPDVRLLLLTPNDPYSDRIAATLPSRVGRVGISYRAVDPAVLLAQYLSGEADMLSILIDPTLSAPTFWSAFWTPGSPFVAFGTAIPEIPQMDMATESGIVRAATAVDRLGNWVGILREEGRLAVSTRLGGLRVTRTGQVSLETLSRNE